MADGRVNSSSVFKLLLVLFSTLFAGQSGRFYYEMVNQQPKHQMRQYSAGHYISRYVWWFQMLTGSVCHFGFDSTKVYNPHQCKRKYLHLTRNFAIIKHWRWIQYKPSLLSTSAWLQPSQLHQYHYNLNMFWGIHFEISLLSRFRFTFVLWMFDQLKTSRPSLLIMSLAANQIYFLSRKHGSAKMTMLTGQKLQLLVSSLLITHEIIVAEEELHLI